MITSQQKAKLTWQCRRGMLELDLILNQFTAKHIDQMDEKQVRAFEHLLSCSDPEIHDWLMGNEVPYEQELVDIVAFIRRQHQV